MRMVGVLALDSTGNISVGPWLLMVIIFGLGAALSIAKKSVTWIDGFVLIGLGMLLGAPAAPVLLGLLAKLGEVLPG